MFDRLPYPQSQNRKSLTEEDYALYAMALADLPPGTIDAACKKWIQEGRFFPLPADIRGACKQADTLAGDLKAERAWERALDFAGAFGNDYKIESARPANDPALEAAARAAGGFRWIAQCSDEQLVWAKKAFLEIYSKWRAVPGLAVLPESKEGRALLADISRLGRMKQLPG